MSIKSHAERELKILSTIEESSLLKPFSKEIISICDAFGKSGQSGGTAPYVINLLSLSIRKLLSHEPLTPVTGDLSEWGEIVISEDNEVMFYNIRTVGLVKDKIDSKPYFIDAIIFNNVTLEDITFTTGNLFLDYKGKKIGSAQYIKGFPFEPKSFYVDVIEERFADEGCTIPDINGPYEKTRAIDPKQLDEVFEYYDILTD